MNVQTVDDGWARERNSERVKKPLRNGIHTSADNSVFCTDLCLIGLNNLWLFFFFMRLLHWPWNVCVAVWPGYRLQLTQQQHVHIHTPHIKYKIYFSTIYICLPKHSDSHSNTHTHTTQFSNSHHVFYSRERRLQTHLSRWASWSPFASSVFRSSFIA